MGDVVGCVPTDELPPGERSAIPSKMAMVPSPGVTTGSLGLEPESPGAAVAGTPPGVPAPGFVVPGRVCVVGVVLVVVGEVATVVELAAVTVNNPGR